MRRNKRLGRISPAAVFAVLLGVPEQQITEVLSLVETNQRIYARKFIQNNQYDCRFTMRPDEAPEPHVNRK
jgi:hypothetical protein